MSGLGTYEDAVRALKEVALAQRWALLEKDQRERRAQFHQIAMSLATLSLQFERLKPEGMRMTRLDVECLKRALDVLGRAREDLHGVDVPSQRRKGRPDLVPILDAIGACESRLACVAEELERLVRQ